VRIDPMFATHLSDVDLESIAASPDIICVVDPELRLRAYNRAWTTFALNNGGEDLLEQYRLGEPIDRAFPGIVKRYYLDAYRKALRENVPFQHVYECSSADSHRRFQQTAYPVRDRSALVISHHLVEERPHREPVERFHERFVGASGVILQCCHCRKTCDPADSERWLWVPELVGRRAANLSHGLCPRCLDFYYSPRA
jgi:hypothetical protein